MTRPRPPVVRLCEMKAQQQGDFFARLAERTRGSTREGKPYYLCRFRDRHRSAAFMVWADSPWFARCESEWVEGDFYKLRGTYGEHDRYGPQIEISQIRPLTEADRSEGFDMADFVESSHFPVDAQHAELRQLAETSLTNEPLRRLVLGLLDTHAAVLKRLPASLGKYHPFLGGWVEHTLSVTRTCLRLAEHYALHYPHRHPPLNRDLLVAAAILHELGRVREIEDDPMTPRTTVEGRFFGNLILARDMIRDAARLQGDVDPEMLRLLEHVVLTHLSLPEWGSPRLPLVAECLILHHADDLDAKMEMYARCLERDRSDGPFTERDPVLGKPLYKGRPESGPSSAQAR